MLIHTRNTFRCRQKVTKKVRAQQHFSKVNKQILTCKFKLDCSSGTLFTAICDKTLHLVTKYTKSTKYLQLLYDLSLNLSVRDKKDVYKGLGGDVCVTECGAFGFITHARLRKHLSTNSPTSSASFPDPSPTFERRALLA